MRTEGREWAEIRRTVADRRHCKAFVSVELLTLTRYRGGVAPTPMDRSPARGQPIRVAGGADS